MTIEETRGAKNKFCFSDCENIDQMAGLLSTFNFTDKHPDEAKQCILALRAALEPVDAGEALKLCREQIQKYAELRLEHGYILVWTKEMTEADDKAEQALTSKDKVMVPRELTAENGMKRALSGEFFELVDQTDDDGNYLAPVKIPVSWTTIKEIHKAMIEQAEGE
jgi:hypothetical protein